MPPKDHVLAMLDRIDALAAEAAKVRAGWTKSPPEPVPDVTESLVDLLEVLDGIENLVPHMERLDAELHKRFDGGVGFLCQPTREERTILETLYERLKDGPDEADLLATRRGEELRVHASTPSGQEPAEWQLEARLRSFQKDVLDVKHPFNTITFQVAGAFLDTRAARKVSDIDLDLTHKLDREP